MIQRSHAEDVGLVEYEDLMSGIDMNPLKYKIGDHVRRIDITENNMNWIYEWKRRHCLNVKFEIDKYGSKICTTKSEIIVFNGRVGDCSGCPYNYSG